MKRLTYVVLAFVPLSLKASILSMNEKALPWSGDFGVYFAVAAPLTAVVLALCLSARSIMEVTCRWNS